MKEDGVTRLNQIVSSLAIDPRKLTAYARLV